MKKRLPAIGLALALTLAACGASGNGAPTTQQTQAENTTSQEETGDETTDDGKEAPEIASDDLTFFAMTAIDPDRTDEARAQIESAGVKGMQNVGYRYELRKRQDAAEAQLTVTAIPLAADYASQTVSVAVSADAFAQLQALVASSGILNAYCNMGDEDEARQRRDFDEETLTKTAQSYLYLEYASVEAAYHVVDGGCAISVEDQLAVRDFFYDQLEAHDVAFYGMDISYDEEAYLDLFLAAAPWDEYVTDEGDRLNLSFGEGRVFSLTVGDDQYAGNYKRRVVTKEGNKPTETLTVTLTTWPALWEAMISGGSFRVDAMRVTFDAQTATGTETLIVHKGDAAGCVFDPYYDADDEIVFTRHYTGLFDATPEEAEEAPEDEGAEETEDAEENGA